ncbi:MAG: hypothetical protein MR910_06770 [Clostridiales bacterium]|nr:hypothetical protein [Clostridiales bacterium]
MYQKLFGQTEEEQMQYLSKRVWVTAAGLVLVLLSAVFRAAGLSTMQSLCSAVGGVLLLVVMFLWGFHAVKALLGLGGVGAIFSGNVVLGVVIFVFAVLLAYVISLVIALLGIGRYVTLCIRARKGVG